MRRLSSLAEEARRQSSMDEQANGGMAGAPAVRVVASLVQGDMRVLIDEEVSASASLDGPVDYLRENEDDKPADRFGGLRSSRSRMSVWKFHKYELPLSTYTFLITERVVSKPFCMGIVALSLSAMSLSIVLINEVNNGTADSPYGLPAGVPTEVRIAQYLGIIIGVLMEEEVPLGLEILGKAVEQKMFEFGREPFKLWKVVLSSFLRMSVGYLFLACLFFTVIQESDVLDIFFGECEVCKLSHRRNFVC